MTTDQKGLIEISDRLWEISQDVRILRNIAWNQEVQQEFFARKAQQLPTVNYAAYDPKPALEQLKQVRKLIKQCDLAKDWATRIADAIENSALMLSTRGTADFHHYSVQLYGSPQHPLPHGEGKTIDLALHFDTMFQVVKGLGAAPKERVSAERLAQKMEKAVRKMFGEHAPEVVMDPDLASNALAGRQRISIRPDASFSDNDVQQLIEHEAYIHVATSINGHLQPHLKILVEGHAGTTSTQEGLAVFAEYITGNIDLDRLQRLSDRVIAINMAMEGADFIEVYRYYLEKTDREEQSFQNAKRVFRGGVLSGGAPFTKDIVYLQGLTDIHNLLKLALQKGKHEYLNLLFVGKLDLEDLPTLKSLSEMGLVAPARFLPPWIKDKRYLLAYLSYSNFMNQASLAQSAEFYEQVLGEG